ncbi:hypothetical protein HK097_002537 [Rhizophlyctis rosea]|uniref:Translation initiation factor IF2/IF5 domain-containing protein n=1 Tax=Rhizophlyctis rosea TaxID=64517 RepID=A0AAD5S3G3_9FUNG|nr:hypothetical protein HK097_002537 [Rhizophlyctis rosea]
MPRAEDENPVEQLEDENPDVNFEGLKKKKKKKKAVPDFEEPVAAEEEEAQPRAADENAEPAGEDGVDEDAAAMFADLKKKKKKKKVTLEGDEAPKEEEPAAATENLDAAFGEKKKKKKRRDLAEFEASLREGAEEGAGDEGDAKEEEGAGKGAVDELWLGSNRDYTYTELLSRVFKILRQNNPELAGEKKRYTIAPPQIMREGPKKTIFANVVDICIRMHRQPDHVIQYLFAELGTTGSIDGSQRLVIRGRFQQKQIENVLKHYFSEYVSCKTCKSADTILTKENRLFFLQCESCGSTRTVSAIKTGFMAQTQKRSAQRAAAGV